jgi:hypothetical protein
MSRFGQRGAVLLVLWLITSGPMVSMFGQKPPAQKPRATAPNTAMATLVDALAKKGEGTILSGYVAVIMDIASDYTEQVPAKALALSADSTHSRLLSLVTKNGVDTILMTEIANGQITAYAMTRSGVLKKAAHGLQYQEFELIPPEQAAAGFKAAKEFWLQQTAPRNSPPKKTPRAVPN